MSPQQLDFLISPKIAAWLGIFFHSQLFVTPPFPTHSFADQTIIVTGSNTGLGLEAARHFYRLKCARLILAVRTVEKGTIAKEDILSSVKERSDADAIEIWPLDLSDTASTIAFADRVKAELPRVDVLVENAGISPSSWTICDGYEQAVQVNVLNTFLMALLLLPKLRETKHVFPDSQPYLVIVSSEAHHLTKFPEINAPDLYAKLNEKELFSQHPRYMVTKLIEVLFTRELVARLKLNTATDPPVIINMVNPGLTTSNLDRSGERPPMVVRVLRRIFDRTTEVGSRTLVLAASAPVSSHGEYHSDGVQQDVESWIYTDVGRRAQKKVFDQTMKILEVRKPGITQEAGL